LASSLQVLKEGVAHDPFFRRVFVKPHPTPLITILLTQVSPALSLRPRLSIRVVGDLSTSFFHLPDHLIEVVPFFLWRHFEIVFESTQPLIAPEVSSLGRRDLPHFRSQLIAESGPFVRGQRVRAQLLAQLLGPRQMNVRPEVPRQESDEQD
jgi:hypothetical protein